MTDWTQSNLEEDIKLPSATYFKSSPDIKMHSIAKQSNLSEKLKMLKQAGEKFRDTQSKIKFISQKLLPKKLNSDELSKIYLDATGNSLEIGKNKEIKLFLDCTSKKTTTFLNSINNKILPNLDEVEIFGADKCDPILLKSFIQTSFPLHLRKLVISENIMGLADISKIISNLKQLNWYDIEEIEIIGYKVPNSELKAVVELSAKTKSLSLRYWGFSNDDLDSFVLSSSKLQRIEIFSGLDKNYQLKSNKDFIARFVTKIAEWSALSNSLQMIVIKSDQNDYTAVSEIVRSPGLDHITLSFQ